MKQGLGILKLAKHYMKVGSEAKAFLLCEREIKSGDVFSEIITFLAYNYEQLTDLNKAKKYFELSCQKSLECCNLYLQYLLKQPYSTPESLLSAHIDFGNRFIEEFSNLKPLSTQKWDNKRKIRVGFTCSFYGASTIQHQFYNWACFIESKIFEVYLYIGDFSIPSYIRNAKADFKVRHTNKTSDTEFVNLTRSDKIDILVELNGFSNGHRFLSMANRCAPIQVSYLNHTSTCGIKNVDYILADKISLLPEEEPYYTEKVYRIPECFFCFNFEDESMPVSFEPPTVSNKYITFGFFGGASKLNEQFMWLILKVLTAIPNSRLLMVNNGMSYRMAREKFYEHFSRGGISRNRIDLLPETNREGIAKCHMQVDINLDSWPYCGGNTLAESFWYGVPAISMCGKRFSERYGASLLSAVGLADLIAYSFEEYVAIASALASDTKRLCYLRKNLRNQMIKDKGFSDSRNFALKMGRVFVDMAKNHNYG